MAKEIIFYNSAKTEQLFPMTEISSVVDSETGVTIREYLNEIDIKIRNIEQTGSGSIDISKYYTKEEVDSQNASQDTTISELSDRIDNLEDKDIDLSGYYTKTEIDNIESAQNIYIQGLDEKIGTLEEETNTTNSLQSQAISGLDTRIKALEEAPSVDVSGKQDIITDLEDIREGASLGKTALQSIPSEYITESELGTSLNSKQDTLVSGSSIKTINGESILGSGNIVIKGGTDVDLSGYYDKGEVDSKLSTKQNTLISGTSIKTINGTSILGSGDITIEVDTDSARVVELTRAEYDALTTYEPDVIYIITDEDVEYIKEDNLKTINGQSLVGSGNIVIEAGSGTVDLSGYYTKTEVDSLNQTQDDTITDIDNRLRPLEDKFSGVDLEETYYTKSDVDLIIQGQDTLISGIDTRVKALEDEDTDLSDYYTKSEVNTELGKKQDTLVSGTSIKTINGNSILGSGNITIEGGSSDGLKLVTLTNEEYKALESYDDSTVYIVTDKKSFNLRVSELETASYYSLNWFNPAEVISGYKIGDDGLLVADSTSMITGIINLDSSRNLDTGEEYPILWVANPNGTNIQKKYRFLNADMNPVGIPNLSGQETTTMTGNYNEGNGGFYSIEYPSYAKYVQLEVTSGTGLFIGNHADYIMAESNNVIPDYKQESFNSMYALIKNLEKRIKALEG